MSRMSSIATVLTLSAALLAFAAGCSTELNVTPDDPTIPVATPPDAGVSTPAPQETGIIATLAAGEVLVDIPASWGEPEQSPRVDEGYVLQDFTWELDGTAQGDVVTAAGMTLGQAQELSGGSDFAAHVEGLADVLAFEEGEPASVELVDVGGLPAARIEAVSPEGMRIILWLYDLGDAYYELGFYGIPGGEVASDRIAEFDAVANTLAVPTGE